MMIRLGEHEAWTDKARRSLEARETSGALQGEVLLACRAFGPGRLRMVLGYMGGFGSLFISIVNTLPCGAASLVVSGRFCVFVGRCHMIFRLPGKPASMNCFRTLLQLSYQSSK